MPRKLEIIGAQGVLPVANETTTQPHEKITDSVLVNNFRDFSIAKNLGHVLNESSQYLIAIAKTPKFQRGAAIEVAKSEVDFGKSLTNEPSLSLEQKISQTHKKSLPTPKLKLN